MQQVPECPRCGVEVQPHWDRCEACGYSHHDADAPVEAPAATPGFFDAPRPGEAIAAGPAPTSSLPAPPPPPPPPPPAASAAPPAPSSAPAGSPPPSTSFAPAAYQAAPVGAPPAYEAPPVGPPAAYEAAPVDAPAPPAGPGPADPGAPPSGFAPSSPPPSFSAAPPPPVAAAGAEPLSAWDQPASAPAPAPTPVVTDADEAEPEDKPRRARKRVTAAQGAKTSSSFELNKVVVGIALVLALVVLAWQASSFLATEDAPVAAPTGPTIPPLGAIASTTTPLTTPDGVTIVPPTTVTPTTSRARDCDSISSIYSIDGKGYTPCDAGFKVDLPGRADIKSSTAETDLGPITWFNLASTDSAADPFVRSVVVYGVLPRELTPEEAAAVQESLVSQLFATPGQPTTFQDQPALSFTGTGAGGETIEGIAFVRGSRAFALATRSTGSPRAALDQLEQTFTFL